MKRHFIFSVLSAVTLMGLTAVTSCSSSSDEVENVNPGYDPATGEVPVNLVLNFSTSNTPTTRQSSAATQANMAGVAPDVFRGIKDAHILTFKRADKNGQWISAAEAADKDYDMSLVAAAATLSNEQSTRVLEMALPLKTNTMVFYGRADGNSDKNKYGHLEVTTDEAAGTVADGYHVEANLNNVYFHLGKRLTAADKVELLQIQKLLAGVMTCIMNTNRGTEDVSASDTPDGVATAYNFDVPNTAALQNLPWSDMVTAEGKSAVSGGDLKPLEEKLVNVYKELTTIQEAELRNGSGPAIKTTVENLWSIVNSVRCASPTDEAEAFAKYMAVQIHEELMKYFTATSMPDDGGSIRGLSIKKASELISSFATDTYWPSEAGDRPVATTAFADITEARGNELAQFPEKFDLPQGATHVKFDKPTKSFYYEKSFNQSAVGSPETSFTVDDYYYPAELLYFGNSPLRVSDTEHVVRAYPQTTAKWDTDANSATTDSWYGWTANSEVQSSTRSVAMRNDINYGTALLKTTVGYVSGVTLKDNNSALHPGEEANEITPSGSTFILKGIVIGGQSPRVGWDFLPALATGEKQGYIFDKDIPNSGAIPSTGESKPTYTLVFDNYDKSKEDGAQNKVFVALEFLNNSNQDFYGKANLIPHGSNFYLVGELNMDEKSITESNWPTYHALPPYTSGTEMKKVTRAFIQDFMTSVSFKIGENSLKYAYLTVPDLRSGSVTLGLSVDLSWSTGLTFDDVVLGGE